MFACDCILYFIHDYVLYYVCTMFSKFVYICVISQFDVGFMLQINHQYAEQLSHLWTRAEGVTVELNAQHAATLTYMEAEDVYKTPCHFHQAPARSAVSTRRSTYYM